MELEGVEPQNCALCFKIASTDVFFEETNDDLVKEMIETIYPQMVPTSDTLNICLHCEETLETVFRFKSNCLDVDDYLRNFVNSSNKVNIHKILNICSEKDKKGRDIKKKICRLCLDIIRDNSFRSCKSVKIMADICLPELDLSLTEKSLFCEKCLELLDIHYNLIKLVEQNVSPIKKRVSNIQGDMGYCDRTQELLKETQGRSTTAMDIQSNNIETDSNILTKHQKMKPKSKRPDKKSTRCDLIEPIDSQVKKCPQCEYTSKENYCLELHVLLTHSDVDSIISIKNSNGVKTFACNECTFESTRDYMVWSHVLTHKDVLDPSLKCQNCKFKCKTRSTLRKHQLTHDMVVTWQPKKIKHGQIYHCTVCSFKQYKGPTMKNHIYKHLLKNITILECKQCSYKTNKSQSLRLHLQCHKTEEIPASIDFFKCVFCQFETENASEFTSHCDTCRAMKSKETLYKIVAIY